MSRARASHILVPTEQLANELKDQLDIGADFGELARKHSKCPSAKQGGTLGEVSHGEMVPEFDQVVFGEQPEDGEVTEPVKTAFGYHLIKIDQWVN